MVEEVTVETTKQKRKKRKLPRREAKIMAREKRIRRAFRVTRFRAFKNFLYWFFGVLSSVGIIASSIFIATGVLPVSVYSDDLTEAVSPNVYDKSLISILGSVSEFTFNDFPILEKSLNEALGEGKKFSAFTEYQKLKALPELDGEFKLAEGSKHSANSLYYIVPQAPVVPQSTDEGGVEPTYANAFDENGALLAGLRSDYSAGTLELYLTPLFSMSVTEGLNSINKYLDYVEITDILKIAGMKEDATVYTILEGISIGDLMVSGEDGGFSTDKLLENATLETLGGADLLGDLGNFKFFTEYEKVVAEDYPTVEDKGGKLFITKEGEGEDEEFAFEPKQYYIEIVAPVPEEGETPAVEGEYARAFTDEGEFITEYVKGDGTKVNYVNLDAVKTANALCYANLSKAPLNSALSLIGESILRQEIVGMITSFGMEVEDDSVIKKIFDGYAIEAFGKSKEEGGFDFETIKLSSILDLPTEENEQKNETIYKILKDATGVETYEDIDVGALGTLNTDGVKLSNVLDLPTEENGQKNQTIYKILKDATGAETYEEIDIASLGAISTDNIKLSNVLDLPTEENGQKNENVYKILKDATGAESYETITINSLSSFTTDNIKLTTVLGGYEGNETLYEIILSSNDKMPVRGVEELEEAFKLRVKTEAEKLTVGNLSGLDTNKVLLTTVLPKTESNQTLYNILKDVTGKTDEATITVGDLSSFDTNKIKLSAVLKVEENEKLYDILFSAMTGVDSKENITIGNLNGFNPDNISLSTVLEVPTEANGQKNETIYKILKEATGATSYDAIKISSLSSFNTENISLSTVLEAPTEANGQKNESIYKILKEATGAESYEAIKISSLSSFNTENISLSSVLELPTEANGQKNATIYKILKEATGATSYEAIKISSLSSFSTGTIKLQTVLPKTENNKTLYAILSDVTGVNEAVLSVGDLGNFNTDNIRLSVVLPIASNVKLYDILEEATGVAGENIKIVNLSSFNIENVKLATVLNETDVSNNNILKALLENDATIGTIGASINSIKLYDIYGKSCFTTTMPEGYTGDKFTKTEVGGVVTYTRDNENGTYYINKTSGIWLLLSYTAEDKNSTNGKPGKYVSASTDMATLQNNGKLLGETFLSASIAQLQEAGLINISGLKDSVAVLSINQVIQAINNNPLS